MESRMKKSRFSLTALRCRAENRTMGGLSAGEEKNEPGGERQQRDDQRQEVIERDLDVEKVLGVEGETLEPAVVVEDVVGREGEVLEHAEELVHAWQRVFHEQHQDGDVLAVVDEDLEED